MVSNKLSRLLKSITWRITASSTTILIVYILSGEIKIAGSVALLEILFKTVIYYLHEMVWDKVESNREKRDKIKITYNKKS